jgi:hypothetical protein
MFVAVAIVKIRYLDYFLDPSMPKSRADKKC